jgi:hypothetical protein
MISACEGGAANLIERNLQGLGELLVLEVIQSCAGRGRDSGAAALALALALLSPFRGGGRRRGRRAGLQVELRELVLIVCRENCYEHVRMARQTSAAAGVFLAAVAAFFVAVSRFLASFAARASPDESFFAGLTAATGGDGRRAATGGVGPAPTPT